MKAIVLEKTENGSELLIKQIEQPKIKQGELLISVNAVAINPVDVFVANNAEFRESVLGELKQNEPIILGWDISGVVLAKGPETSRFNIGDEVFGLIKFYGHAQAYAEVVSAPENQLTLKPKNVSHAEAAAASLAALTAWQSLVTYGKTVTGSRVLIHGASGGVGHYAVQIAKALGAYVIGTGKAENLNLIRSFGADEVIDYELTAFESVTNNIDVVIDGVAFTHEHLIRSVSVLHENARLISLLSPIDLEVQNALENKKSTGHQLSVAPNKDDIAEIAKLLSNGKVRSHIESIFSFAEVKLAYEKISLRGTRGKIVMNPSL